MPAKRDRRPSYILDTSAIIALLQGEPGVIQVKDLLRAARRGHVRVAISLMTKYEVLYLALQDLDEEAGRRRALALRFLDLEEVPLDERIAIRAAQVKANHRISVADSWIAATAVEAGATLVHKDPEMLALEGIVKLETLPLK